MSHRLYIITALLIAGLTASTMSAQTTKGGSQQSEVAASVITGTVYEKKTGETLPGASVAVYQDGQVKTGVMTDIDGNYNIKLPTGNYELRVSYIGFRKQIIPAAKVKDRGMKIYLIEEENNLKDVVVTGFFNKNKKTFTGSATQISGDDLRAVTGTNIFTALAALTPGLEIQVDNAAGSNPNHVSKLIMRGMSSFDSAEGTVDQSQYFFNKDDDYVNRPTIILDGSEISLTELYDLDMNEIESISVLKDAAATALYGSKAANGVIVITRKPLTEGAPHVSYSFIGKVQIPQLGDYRLLNASEKLEYERLAGLYTANPENYRDPVSGTVDLTSLMKQQSQLDDKYNKYYKQIASGQESDWLSQPARTSFSHDHSVRVYGGANSLRYEVNGRFSDTKGVMKGDLRRRYNIGYKLDYFIKNKILISNRSTYSEVATKDTPYGEFSQYTLMNPYERMYNEDGSANLDLNWNLNNPLYEALLGNYKKTSTATFTNSTDARWEISPLFRLTGHFNISTSRGTGDEFKSPDSRLFKSETDITKRGYYRKASNSSVTYNANIVGSFNKLLADKSLISVSAGWEVNHSSSDNATMKAIGYFNDQYSAIYYATSYPTTETPSGSSATSADVGLFTTGNYSFRDRYFADATWRMTGSSQFGENNRYGHFYSFGLGWNILNEKFMEKIRKHFDILKLRGSWGYTGKATFSAYQAMTMYQYSNDLEYRNGIGATPVTIGDTDLSWERTNTLNIGFDLSAFNRRLNLTVDYYIKNTTDLLLERAKAPSTGVTTATQNLGEMQNRGLELSLDGFIIKNRNFYWKLGTTGYTNINKITHINEALKAQNEANAAVQDDAKKPLPQYAEGESVTALKLVESAGIDPATGKEVYIKRNGSLTFDYDVYDKILAGDTEPRWYGTVNTSVYWKGITVYALFSYRMGGWIYNTTRATKVEGSDPKYNADSRVFADRWKNPGDQTYYKNIADSSTPKQSTRFAEKENTLTMTSLNISYEFGEKLAKSLSLRSLRAGINFTDLFYLSTVKQERGTEYLYSKGFEFNINATF